MLRNTVLADSDGVIVALVMFVMTDLESSSLSPSTLSGLLVETVEILGDLAVGWGPLLSFYRVSTFSIYPLQIRVL